MQVSQNQHEQVTEVTSPDQVTRRSARTRDAQWTNEGLDGSQSEAHQVARATTQNHARGEHLMPFNHPRKILPPGVGVTCGLVDEPYDLEAILSQTASSRCPTPNLDPQSLIYMVLHLYSNFKCTNCCSKQCYSRTCCSKPKIVVPNNAIPGHVVPSPAIAAPIAPLQSRL